MNSGIVQTFKYATDSKGISPIIFVPGHEELSSLSDLNPYLRKLSTSSEIPTEKLDFEGDTIDHLVNKFALNPGFIKLDTEEAEYLVLRGAINTLKTYKPIVLSELSDTMVSKFDANSEMVVSFLQEQGYKVINVYIALLSVSENHAQSKSMRAFPHNDLSGEFLIETQKGRPIGKTHTLSGLQRLRSPRVTEERYSISPSSEVHFYG